jgi:septal ring factor EnvC (AmiA/AmiB activator)
MSDVLSTGVIATLGGVAVVVALAFRHLVDTIVQLNRELREAIDERTKLYDKISQLETHIIRLEAQLAVQTAEIEALRKQLTDNQLVKEF